MRAAYRTLSRVLPVLLGATVLAACGSDAPPDSGDAAPSRSGASGSGEPVELTVLAAASLTDVFEQAEEVFEAANPDITLRFSFAGSQELAAQVEQGAPADVLVTADTATMEGVADLAGDPTLIARNALTLVTPPDDPGDVDDLADLADPDLRLVLAAPEVPAGRYGREILDRLGIDARPDSEEPNVRAVLSKVELGEADAGLVYVTDATAAGEGAVRSVPIPEEDNVLAEYPAAALTASEHADAAREFVDWLVTDEAQRVLADAGFLAP